MTTPASHTSRRTPSDADPLIDALMCEFVPKNPGRRKSPPDLTAAILEQLNAPADPSPADEASVDDRDPVVDTLLAEFIPGDQHRRVSPPDLTDAILQKLAEAEGLHESEESQLDRDPVIDALLPEFVPASMNRRSRPPNLAGKIVTQLSDARKPGRSTVLAEETPVSSVSARRMGLFALAAAASLFAMIWLSGWNNSSPNIADNDVESQQNLDQDAPSSGGDPSQLPSSGRGSLAQVPPSDPGSEAARPAQGVTLDSPVIAMESGEQADVPATDGQPAVAARRSVPIDQVAAESRETAYSYWEKLGLTPTPAAPTDELIGRLKSRLGITLSEESLAEPGRLRNTLAQESNAREIAERWLALTSGNNLATVEEPENRSLVSELMKGVRGETPIDTTLVSLINGSNPQSSRWYENIGRRGSEGIAKHLASLSINADMRCVRCHDSHIGRSGTQDDYWSFVALIRNVVEREGTRWVVAQDPKQSPTFFELLDGRQRMAAPKVSGYLLQSSEPIENFQAWTNTLVGSDALAGSLVDSLWKLVHGRPLKPSPVDAFAPPYDGSLDDLHRLLVEDLKASDFDLARTLSLIISSPMTNRSVPAALQDDAMLTASDGERSEALQLVSAFAASVQPPRSGIDQRIDVAMRRIGERLHSGDQGAMLAQPMTLDPRKPGLRTSPGDVAPVISLQQKLSVDFPGEDASLPVAWLRSIDDFDRQVQHLVYLSGRDRVPPEIKDAAERLRASGSDASALSRIWWILRN